MRERERMGCVCVGGGGRGRGGGGEEGSLPHQEMETSISTSIIAPAWVCKKVLRVKSSCFFRMSGCRRNTKRPDSS